MINSLVNFNHTKKGFFWGLITNSTYDPTVKIGLVTGVSVNFLYNSLLSLIFLSCMLFIAQNILLPKILDSLTERKFVRYDTTSQWASVLTNNQMFLYPYKASLVLCGVLFFLNPDSTYSDTLITGHRFEPFAGQIINPRFVIDEVSITFLLTTMSIGLLVNLITPAYMEGEVNQQRFYNLLNCFLFSMMFLLMAYNLLTLFLFWELIGLFSYFLINFWNKKAGTFKSAMKAMAYNQISDAFFLLAIILYWKQYSTVTLPNQYSIVDVYTNGSNIDHTLLVISILISVSCKSAQLPFHFWLPDSMDAPAPASSLIHSATLVAAGVFLLIKLKPMWQHEVLVMYWFELITLITITAGGLAAVAHTDMKKMLAYSTISNCGFMLYFAIASTVENASLFFMAHGLLKAGSFALISILIVKTNHKQDLRYVGGYSTRLVFLVPATILSLGSLGSLPLAIMQQIKHGVLATSKPQGLLAGIKSFLLDIGLVSSTLYSTKMVHGILYGHKNVLKTAPQVNGSTSCVPIISIVTYCTGILSILYLCYFFKIYEWSSSINFTARRIDNLNIQQNTPQVHPVTQTTSYFGHLTPLVQASSLLFIGFPIWSNRFGRWSIDFLYPMAAILLAASLI